MRLLVLFSSSLSLLGWASATQQNRYVPNGMSSNIIKFECQNRTYEARFISQLISSPSNKARFIPDSTAHFQGSGVYYSISLSEYDDYLIVDSDYVIVGAITLLPKYDEHDLNYERCVVTLDDE
ncbi:hypothetical protein K3495_g12507 [Podosphaera aphanis]|nr:hypothetical protein K3495_g12507 [Podosphaera aphanis]